MPFCYDYPRRDLFNEPAGRDVVGYDDLSRFYYTSSDTFLLLSAYESDTERFENVEELQGFSTVPKEGRAAFLAEAFMSARASDWVERLQGADIAAAICENIDSIRTYNSRPAVGASGTSRGSYSFSVYEDHPSGHVVTQLDPYAVRPLRGRVLALTCAEKYGASTREILRELGYDDEGIQQLIEQGTISESWSREYLPS